MHGEEVVLSHQCCSITPILSGLWLLVMLGYEVMKGYGGGLLDYFI